MKPYQPRPLPIEDLDTARLIRLIGPANAALARYDGLLRSVVNPSIMLSPLTNREAVLSSRIEGTQATVDEVLEFEAGIEFDPEKVKDIQEIVNYRSALSVAASALRDYPLNLVMIREIHRILMDSVRGADKTPGEFRKDQNWIGPMGCRIEEATFVPPSPLQLGDHLDAFERYLALDDIDPLVQVAIVHAQFELIHPFKDGNGRVGRLLVPLFLFRKQVLGSPTFYLSEYLERNRDRYYHGLRAISQEDDWTGWVVFFLEAIIGQAKANTDKVQAILELYEEMKVRCAEITRSHHSVKVLDTLFDKAIFRSSDFVDRSGIPKTTALAFLRKLEKDGVLHILHQGKGRRSTLFAFRELLNLTEGMTVIREE